MRFYRVIIIATTISACCGSSALATSLVPLSDGAAQFAAGVTPYDGGVVRNWTFTLAAWAESFGHSPAAIAEVHVKLPPELALVEGESSRSGLRVDVSAKMRKDRFWRLRVRAPHQGDYVVLTSIRMMDGDVMDESEWETTLHVMADTVTGLPSPVWAEREQGGRRYRYGGRYMVLLDGKDPIPLSIDKQPEVLDQPPGVCVDCGLPESVVVSMIVTVGRDGSVIWAQPDRLVQADPHAMAAAEAALKKWRYLPALAHGRPVPQWAVAKVVVRNH